MICSLINSSHGLSQIVDQPTRGNSILDIVLCSDVLCCDDVEVLLLISTSDHNTVCFRLCLYFTQQHSPTKESPPRHNFAKADWESSCNFLAATDWHFVFSDCYTADDLWNAYISVVQQAINKFVPRDKHSRHMFTPCLYPRYPVKFILEPSAF